MVEELKAEMRKLENLIGFQGKVDVTSRQFTQELIRALDSKYKEDVKNSLRLHQLEFYHDLIESAQRKQRKTVEVEEELILGEKEKEDDDEDEEEVEEKVKEKELFKKPKGVVAVKAENIDEWKDLMTLSRIYYVLEHPNSTGITWKRRIAKKKSISKFSDKDLIEWRVAQNFKLRGLEEWALSRSEARKVAEKSPYDFDDLLEDDESRELEDMFNILGTQRQKKRKVGQLEKSLKSDRPFKFKDEGVEDWTESYSDDSEESGVEDMAEEILELDEESDFKVDDYKVSSEEPTINEAETISEIFSVYEDKPKFRNPVFEEMDKAETMERWFDLCHEAVGVPSLKKPQRSPPQILFTIEEGEDEEYIDTEIPDNIGYIRGQEIEPKEAKEKDIERTGGRIPVKEVKEKDVEKPGDDSEEPPILAPYTGEEMHIKEAGEKDIERPGGRIPVKEAREKDIENLGGRIPEPDKKGVDLGKLELDTEETLKDKEITSKKAKDKDVKILEENLPLKEAKERDFEPQEDFEKPTSSESLDRELSRQSESEKPSDMSQIVEKEYVTSAETGSISQHDEEIIKDQIKHMTKEGKSYALSDAENEAALADRDAEPTKNGSATSSGKQTEDLEMLLRKESKISDFESGASEEKEKLKSLQIEVSQEAAREDLKHMLNKAKSSASREIREKPGKSSSPTKSSKEHGEDLETSLRRESEQEIFSKRESTYDSDSLGEIDLDNESDRKASKSPSMHQGSMSVQDEQLIGQRLQSIIDEGKTDAREEKEKEYKKRRSTLLHDDSNNQGPDLESVLKSESILNVTNKSDINEELPQVEKSETAVGTIDLKQEEDLKKRLKSTIEEAKPTALNRKDEKKNTDDEKN